MHASPQAPYLCIPFLFLNIEIMAMITTAVIPPPIVAIPKGVSMNDLGVTEKDFDELIAPL